MFWANVLVVAGGASLVSALELSSFANKAIVPTRSGQIGVNPVQTKILTVNTELLTDLPYVTTVNNIPTVTTAAANFAASVVTDVDSLGAVAIQMDETSHKAFVKIADGVDAKIACGQGRRFMKRQTCAARLTQLAKEVGQAIEDGTLALAHNKDLAIVAAQPEVAAAVAGFPAVVGLLLTGYYITHTQPDGKIAAAYTLPKEMVNTSGSNKEKSCPQTELKCKDCKGSSLGVCAYPWPGCPCTKPKECPDPQPECPDEKCKGEGGDNMCTTDELKGCPCKFKCPWEPEKMPNCEDCGGDTGSQTCKADYKGANNCGCNDFPETNLYPYRLSADWVVAPDGMPFTTPNKTKPSENQCITLEEGDERKRFDWGRANLDTMKFCKGGFNLKDDLLYHTYDHTKDDINMKLQLAIARKHVSDDLNDANFKAGCKPTPSDATIINQEDCHDQFVAAMEECQKDSFPWKTGNSPRTLRSPTLGCIDFYVVGHGPDWSCDDNQDAPECQGSLTKAATAPFHETHCVENHGDTHEYVVFDKNDGESDYKDFCKGGIDLLTPAAPIWKTYKHTGVKVHLAVQWSKTRDKSDQQEGCSPNQNLNHLDEEKCIDEFQYAMNFCNINTRTLEERWGQNWMTWNSAGGCVDFYIAGRDSEWSCKDASAVQPPPECMGKQKE